MKFLSINMPPLKLPKTNFLKTGPCTAKMWQIVKFRSANIPTTWDAIANMAALFELSATLEQEHYAQMKVLKKLRRENNFFEFVDEKIP